MWFIPKFRGRQRNRNNRHNRSARRATTTRLRFEPLESRVMLADLTTLHFNIPPETANLGVEAGLYSNTSKLYLDPTSHTFEQLSGAMPTVPLFSLAQRATDAGKHTEPVQCELIIPAEKDVKSGELFIFVGEINEGLKVSDDGTVAAPKAAPNPATIDVPDNFAQFEFNYQKSGPGAGLDIDISAVDSTGFPFTLVYPASANLPFPINPLGITLDQADLNVGFREAFQEGGQYSQYPEFAQCATFAQQQAPQSLQVVAPQDILAMDAAPPILNSVTPTADAQSRLAAGANYSYCITAFSDNVIANSGKVHGETLLSNVITVSNMADGTSNHLSWNQYHDPNTVGYNIYRYSSTDGHSPTDSTTYSLIARAYGATTTTYVDQGAIPQAQQISADTHNSYGFNPLSEYYTRELQDFFAHYSAPNSFSIRRNGSLWVGNTVNYTPEASWNDQGATYTVLQLTAQNSAAGTTIEAGDVINLYLPIFSSNTRFVLPNAPPMPRWMTAATSPNETPAQMVFGCDAAFASDKHDPDVADNDDLATALGAIENAIVSAFNRGIATNYSIPPDNWASFPQMLDFPAVTSDSHSLVASTTTYYYAVTAVNAYGETTPSLTVAATLSPGEVATLNWSSGEEAAPATAYKVYRGTSPYDLKLLHTTSNGQQTSYTDLGGPAANSSLANQYFAPGTTSNWYAAFVQTNSLLDPKAGVSINGLSYGFPYSDQGGTSTNILFPPGDIPKPITVNLGSPHSPGFVTQSLADALVNSPYRETLVASGTGSDTKFSIAGGELPDWLTLNDDTGVLHGNAPKTPTSSPYEFTVQITNSVGSTSMPFRFDVIDAKPVAPVTVTGLSGTNLNLTAADVNLPYSTRIQATGGVGPYTLRLAPSVTLPAGIDLGGLGPGEMTSSTGLFTLSGTQTQVYDDPDVGFDVVVSDSTIASATAVLGISEETVEINNPGTGYAVGDRFQIVGGGGSGAVIEVATVGVGGEIQSMAVVDPGSGFTSAPTSATPISVSGSGAAIGLRGDRFAIVDVAIANPGSGYAEAPTVTISGGGVANQTVTATPGTGNQTGQIVAIAPPTNVYFTPQAGLPQVHVDPPSTHAQCTFTTKLTVNPTLAIETQALPAAVKGQSYCQTITTNQKTDGVEFAVTEGGLPDGLKLEPWGVLCGTPTGTGSFPFTVTATDAAGGVASKSYNSFEVTETAPPPLTITASVLPPAAPGVNYSQTIGTTGGSSGDIAFNLVNGALPDGLSLSGAGQITGTPAANAGGVARFTVRATDRAGNTAFQGYALGVLDVTRDTHNLAANANTLVIQGAGFDSTPGNNTVALPGSGATDIVVTSATPTRLELSFSGPLATGPLQATVTVNGATSNAQQVANVTHSSTPTITASTDRLAANAAELVVRGTGFDTSGQGTNAVSLSSGTVKSVTVDSSTQLTLALEGPMTLGPLTATVNTNGVSSASQQVANVVTSGTPTINCNPGNLYRNEDTLVIYGTGFDSNAHATTQVELSLPTQSVPFNTITVNSATKMTINGVSLPSTGLPAVLTAKVTVNGIESQETKVATALPNSTPVLALPPTLPHLAYNATTITLYGWGFTSGSSVTLQRNYGKGWEAVSSFTTTVDSPNQITITGLNLPMPTNGEGTLGAIVNDPTYGTTGGIAAVAKVLTAARSAPTIAQNANTISSGTTTLTIKGTGFDPNGTNIVCLYADGIALPPTTIAPTDNGDGKKVTVGSDGTWLSVELAGDLPLGDLRASATTHGVAMAGDPVQVATVVGPSIKQATTKLSRSPALLTVRGVGFDPNGTNRLTLYTGTGHTELPASTIESVVADSSTRLTVILNTNRPLPAAELFATASVNGVSSGAPTQIADVINHGPVINMAANQLASDANTLVINGSHFGTTTGSNHVVLTTFDGQVVNAVKEVSANAGSQLTLKLIPGVLKVGELYARVATANARSDLVLVAEVVPAPPSTQTSTLSVSSRFLHSGQSAQVTLRAKDSLGRSTTPTQLEVALALTPDSAGGTLGPIADNGHGTYTATFTSQNVGSNTLIATIDGRTIVATCSVAVYENIPWYHFATRPKSVTQSSATTPTGARPQPAVQSGSPQPTRALGELNRYQPIINDTPLIGELGLVFRLGSGSMMGGSGGLPQGSEKDELNTKLEYHEANDFAKEHVEPNTSASPRNDSGNAEEPRGSGGIPNVQEPAEQEQSHGRTNSDARHSDTPPNASPRQTARPDTQRS